MLLGLAENVSVRLANKKVMLKGKQAQGCLIKDRGSCVVSYFSRTVSIIFNLIVNDSNNASLMMLMIMQELSSINE